MEKIKLAYFGSPDFSADFLEKILLDKSLPVEIKLVVTQPDRLVGRKRILSPTPVKLVALKHGLKFLEIGNFLGQLDQLEIRNFDLALVYAYGKLIPKELLNIPKYGFWCIHPSLLPKYRGTSPMATALINGDKKTGVSIFKMDEEIDHGPIIAQENLTIDQDDKRPDLERKLTNLAFEMFRKILSDKDIGFSNFSFLEKARIESRLTKQNHNLATYTKKLTKQDGFISFENLKLKIENSSEDLYNLFRGLYPWPGLWTMIKPIQPTRLDEAKRLKITDMELVNGKLIIKKVQLEGKKEVDFETFNKAYKLYSS